MMQNTHKTSQSRQSLRQTLLAQRSALPHAVRNHCTEKIILHLDTQIRQLVEHKKKTSICFYWPVRGEINLKPLAIDWFNRGHSILLPIIDKPNSPLGFCYWSPHVEMEKGRYGIPHPKGARRGVPDTLLLPVVAIDQAGYRLGYGGGYFDRTLSTLTPKPLSIGIGFNFQRQKTICPEKHDQRLDALVTETGYTCFK